MRSAVNVMVDARDVNQAARKVRILLSEYEHIVRCNTALENLVSTEPGLLLGSSALNFPLRASLTASVSNGFVRFSDEGWESVDVKLETLTGLFDVKFASVKFVIDGRTANCVVHAVSAAFVDAIRHYTGVLHTEAIPGFHTFPMAPTDMAFDKCHFEEGFCGELLAHGRAFYLDLKQSRLGIGPSSAYGDIAWVYLVDLVGHFYGELY